jgi:hypothetical protein
MSIIVVPPSAWMRPVLFLALLLLSSAHELLPAIEMGPGMFMLQDVPLGREVNLRKIGGLLFTVYNRSDQAQDYTLSCRRPSQGGLAAWEKGYDEIPNAAWCYLEETTVTVPPKSEKQVGLIVNIPDEPENWNRKFMLAVILSSGKNDGTSIGLAVACRVQIETAVREQLAGGATGGLSLAPGTITVRGRPGQAFSGLTQVRNDTGKRIEAQIQRLPEIYVDPVKHPRYLSNGFQAHPGEAWLAPDKPAFALDAGGVQTLAFNGTVPADAKPGQAYEELAFITANAAEGKTVMTFLRVHVELSPTAAKPAP